MCNEPFIKELKDKGYYLVTYPKTSIKPLHIYQSMKDSKIFRLFVKSDIKPTSGFLKDLFENHSGAIGLSTGNGIGINTVTTQKIDSGVSVEILTNYLNTLLPVEKQIPEPQVRALFSNTKNIVFKIEKINTIDVNELALRNWLNENQRNLRKTYETDIANGTLYIACSLMKSSKISLTCERTNTAQIAAEFASLINLPIGEGGLNFSNENTETDKLLYSGNEGIIVGVKLVRLKFSDKGILTIDNKQDFNRVLSESIEADFFETNEDVIDIE